MTVTVNSYFSGAGLMDIGLMQAGIQINQAFELDKKAVDTYRHNIGNHMHWLPEPTHCVRWAMAYQYL